MFEIFKTALQKFRANDIAKCQHTTFINKQNVASLHMIYMQYAYNYTTYWAKVHVVTQEIYE